MSRQYKVGDYRWSDDCRILAIAAAPPGWYAYGRDGDDYWRESIAVFALVEDIQREEVLELGDDGEERWRDTGRSESDIDHVGGPSVPSSRWRHTRVVPIAWNSGEGMFPGADELTLAPYEFVTGPGDEHRVQTWLSSVGGDATEANPNTAATPRA